MAGHLHRGDRYGVTVLAGDHVLFIGEVEHLEYRDGTPLLFYTGAYRALHAGLTEDVFFY
jgi:flavin reductase (DIM6/NTAB) family NADH-FMN oxidoreductase RutF